MNGHSDMGAFSLPYGIVETIEVGEHQLQRNGVPKPWSFMGVRSERFIREDVILNDDLEDEEWLQVYDTELMFQCGDGRTHIETVRCYGD